MQHDEDLVARADLERRDEEFCRRLRDAIQAGSELLPTSILHETERPQVLSAPLRSADVPDRPATLQGQNGHALAQARRREFRTDLLTRRFSQPTPPRGQYTILDLSEERCHFPSGRTSCRSDGLSFLFCGEVTEAERSYCPAHDRRCFATVER